MGRVLWELRHQGTALHCALQAEGRRQATEGLASEACGTSSALRSREEAVASAGTNGAISLDAATAAFSSFGDEGRAADVGAAIQATRLVTQRVCYHMRRIFRS
jgi:hypothetical protein